MSTLESLEPRRLLAAGDVDPTFGTAGQVELGNNAELLIPQGGGKVLLVGADAISRRGQADFSLDTSFGSGGSTPLSFAPPENPANATGQYADWGHCLRRAWSAAARCASRQPAESNRVVIVAPDARTIHSSAIAGF